MQLTIHQDLIGISPTSQVNVIFKFLKPLEKEKLNLSSILLAVIANLDVQSSERTFFTMLFCSLTPPTMLHTNKLIFLIGTPYLAIIASHSLSFKFGIILKVDKQVHISISLHGRKI